MIKSVKEAKLHTSWLTPHEEYEAAVASFVERTLTGPAAPKFLAAFEPFAARVARAGLVNGLAQVVMKLGSPGVPDFYQGTDLWDFSLVDPDNRRPVDFEHRARAARRSRSGAGAAGRRAQGGGGGAGGIAGATAASSCWSRRRGCGCAATNPISSWPAATCRSSPN